MKIQVAYKNKTCIWRDHLSCPTPVQL